MTSGPIVLVVDDDPDILEALSGILEDEGIAVRRARNGAEALVRISQETVSLLLLDLMMPIMDGWEVARRVRAQYGERLPIILLSADRQVAKEAKELGVAAHLAKPFELSELLRAVGEWLAKSGTVQSA